MLEITASWPVAGDGLRVDSGESAQFPTGVKAVGTLLGQSRTHGTVVLPTMFEGQTRLWPFENRALADQARAGRRYPEIR
jgi:hypothetical protein